MSKAYIDCGGSKCHIKTDSGCEWVVGGYNPLLHETSLLKKQLTSVAEISAELCRVQEIRYYGAGCSGSEARQQVYSVLHALYPKTSIRVGHDLDLCFDLVLQDKRGIVGILGTGSNAAYYDGEKALQAVPSLGFILGDQGGGASMGRRLVADFYHHRMPSDLREYMTLHFEHAQYDLLIRKVYHEKGGNQFLASLTQIMSGQFRQSTYVQNLLKSEFELYIDQYIIPLSPALGSAVSFTGSIAYIFKAELERVMRSRNLVLGVVCKQPLNLL